jgi:hypothetical protein
LGEGFFVDYNENGLKPIPFLVCNNRHQQYY